MKIVFFANTDWYLYNFRLALAENLRDHGHEVTLVSPDGRHSEKLRGRGFTWTEFDLARRGTNPLEELRTLNRLIELYRVLKPDLVHHFTIKCVLYGGFAARWLGIPSVSAVTGMGHVFTTHTIKNALLRPAISTAYRYALKRSQVIFQNPDDRADFLSRGFIANNNAHLIRGSGVNVTQFMPKCVEIGQAQVRPRILFVGRLLREKGVAEFVEAASIVRAARPDAQFRIAGEPDEGNPSAISSWQIKQWSKAGNIEWLGHCADMPSLLRASSICVLPSYREGTPRSLLEAAASGLPLIATDVPGCREICRDGVNGTLVAPRDAKALAAAIIRLIDDPARCHEMGLRSREIAVAEFSEEKVIAETKKVYAVAAEAHRMAGKHQH